MSKVKVSQFAQNVVLGKWVIRILVLKNVLMDTLKMIKKFVRNVMVDVKYVFQNTIV